SNGLDSTTPSRSEDDLQPGLPARSREAKSVRSNKPIIRVCLPVLNAFLSQVAAERLCCGQAADPAFRRDLWKRLPASSPLQLEPATVPGRWPTEGRRL